MSKLLPCPFCGGEAELVCNDIGVFVGCFHENCPIGPQTSTYLDGYATEAEAIAAWNARADAEYGWSVPATDENMAKYGWVRERTCRNANTDGYGFYFECSECGYSAIVHNCAVRLDELPNYCPNCGARVIGTEAGE